MSYLLIDIGFLFLEIHAGYFFINFIPNFSHHFHRIYLKFFIIHIPPPPSAS